MLGFLYDNPNHNLTKEGKEDEFINIQFFQKGTTHLRFNHFEMIERMNDIIAKQYPEILASPP
ncbi:DUF4942 domain-containing protein [Enterobacteriaceae bacterium H18W14]|uniref:DUF4942 domain-containing protein n=1 Tax=Dryocola boscaweniae TaxID=2925397 RepID=UPI0022F0C277|nr:DUF4942 domain-containing protein [Dryocola boscaweniae]MCT4714774.1 DUF4942 domain-containing protein [Dryocola boscaweniae]